MLLFVILTLPLEWEGDERHLWFYTVVDLNVRGPVERLRLCEDDETQTPQSPTVRNCQNVCH